MGTIVDIKEEIMDYLLASEMAARKSLQESLNRRYKGQVVQITTQDSNAYNNGYVYNTHTVTIQKIVLAESGYGVFIITDKGNSYRVHPNRGMELIGNETNS